MGVLKMICTLMLIGLHTETILLVLTTTTDTTPTPESSTTLSPSTSIPTGGSDSTTTDVTNTESSTLSEISTSEITTTDNNSASTSSSVAGASVTSDTSITTVVSTSTDPSSEGDSTMSTSPSDESSTTEELTTSPAIVSTSEGSTTDISTTGVPEATQTTTTDSHATSPLGTSPTPAASTPDTTASTPDTTASTPETTASTPETNASTPETTASTPETAGTTPSTASSATGSTEDSSSTNGSSNLPASATTVSTAENTSDGVSSTTNGTSSTSGPTGQSTAKTTQPQTTRQPTKPPTSQKPTSAPTKEPNKDTALAVIKITLVSNGSFSDCNDAACLQELIHKLKEIFLLYSNMKGFSNVALAGIRSGSIIMDFDMTFLVKDMGNDTLASLAKAVAFVLKNNSDEISSSVPSAAGVLNKTALEDMADELPEKYSSATECDYLHICDAHYNCLVKDGYKASCALICQKECSNGGLCYVDVDQGLAKCRCQDDGLFQYYGDWCQNRGATKELILILCLSIGGGLVLIFLTVIACMSRRMISQQQEHKLLSMDRISSMTEEELAMRQLTYTSPVNKFDEKVGKFQSLPEQGYDNMAYESSERASRAYEYLPDNTVIYRGMSSKKDSDAVQNSLENIDPAADYSIRRPRVTPAPDKINSRYVYQELEMKTSI